ncbi:hypothetical protein TraAM80_04955 [Trypanosoma rangeli]|uniref:Uncharacterized protein n=1 Tax=Trypanosoma rangeli TaxID=5698 RepID=A0A422NH97_TRYRA|nr:uncharacterized protein TraAM80_04955 [Trypanosoma rangeli]RNF04824.1 hypothetical protein TraAM80_04955 [Trypanosoma rangeli]|eukprot:RNF04824.1 hypothetical protein TraAM80_04955 [Trypanosoma rangeli]
MDAFQEKLDALQKQSKEQIMAAVAALQHACGEGVQPLRIAVAIGNRLTPGQVSNSFPVICLIDAMTIRQEEACVVAVLEEFWRIAPSLFVNFAAADEALQEKVSRAVKRWGGKKVLSASCGERLLRCINGKETTEVDFEAARRAAVDNANTASQASSHSGIAVNEARKEEFSRAEVSGFCAILQSCIKMIERLPPHRASMYLEVARKEKLLRTPSKSALLFFQGLHAELSRESAMYNSNLVKSEHQATPEAGGRVDPKAALGNLLDKLSKEQSFTAESATVAAGGHHDPTFNVIRYASPMQSDIFQRLSVAQRAGFGEWHRRTKNEYHYPKEGSSRRVFRAPAGSLAGTRAWFPSEQQWIGENDMAALRLWVPKETGHERESSSVYDVARKRERDA